MLPQGWLIHPDNPAYMYNPTTGQLMPLPPAAPPMAAPVPQIPQVTAPMAYPQVTQQQQPQAQGTAAFMTPTADLYAQQLEHVNTPPWKRDGEDLWLRFEETKKVGDVSSFRVRILPGVTKAQWWAEYARHRVSGEYFEAKQGEQKKAYYFTCPGQSTCAICDISRELLKNTSAATIAKELRATITYLVQAVNMTDPTIHWQQLKDAAGSPLIGSDGQPQWIIRPALFEMKTTLYKAILKIAGARLQEGDITHPELGRSIVVSKTKTGKEDMNVEYEAIDDSRSPLDPAIATILLNRHDLDAIVLRGVAKPEDLQEVANNVRAKFMNPQPQAVQQPIRPPVPAYVPQAYPAPQFQPGPVGQPYAQPPTMPPMMAPPPMVLPMAPPPMVQPPQVAPMLPPNLPPAAPPMPQIPQVGQPPVIPGAPPPPPGMPVGSPMGMTGQQFEQQLLPGAPPKGSGGVPY